MEKKINVSQKAVILNGDGKVLTIRRTKTAPSRPLHWDLPGGALEFGEDTTQGIIREVKEETGLNVADLKILDVYSRFSDKNEFWLTICYLAKTKNSEIKLSWEHDSYKWVSPVEFQKLKASPTNRRFIKKISK